jgi:hypothetical protein
MPPSGLVLKLCLTAMLLAGELLLLSQPAQSQQVRAGVSPLCKSRGLRTVFGFTTKSFHIAICDNRVQTFYVGEDLKHKNRIFLPAADASGEQEMLGHFIARNGAYTYDVNLDHYSKANSFGILSVFQGNRRILYQTSAFAFGNPNYFR